MLPSPQRQLLRSVFKKRLFYVFGLRITAFTSQYVEIIFRRNIDEKKRPQQQATHRTQYIQNLIITCSSIANLVKTS